MTGRARHIAGHAAEDTVARAYQSRGVQILERRWRSAAGEIDLIARDGDTFVFVEVKQRQNTADAAHAIRPEQWARIGRAAEIYVYENHGPAPRNMRFDAAFLDSHGNLDIVENAAEF